VGAGRTPMIGIANQSTEAIQAINQVRRSAESFRSVHGPAVIIYY